MPSAKVAPTVETDEKGEKSQLSPSASLLIAKTDEKASTATSHDSKGGAGPGFPKAKVISVNAAVAVSFGGRTFTKVAGSGVVVGAMASPPKDKKDGGGGTPGRKKQQLTVKVGDILTIAMFTSDLSELYRATNELGEHGTLPPGVELEFIGSSGWRLQDNELLRMLCMLGSSEGAQQLQDLDNDPIARMKAMLDALPDQVVRAPINEWCLTHFPALVPTPAAKLAVETKLQGWIEKGWSLAHIMTQQVMGGSSEIIKDSLYAGGERLREDWNWCRGAEAKNRNSGASVAMAVLRCLCRVDMLDELVDKQFKTPFHLLCSARTNRIIREEVTQGTKTRAAAPDSLMKQGSNSSTSMTPRSGDLDVTPVSTPTRSKGGGLTTPRATSRRMKSSDFGERLAAAGAADDSSSVGVELSVYSGTTSGIQSSRPTLFAAGPADVPIVAWLKFISESGAAPAVTGQIHDGGGKPTHRHRKGGAQSLARFEGYRPGKPETSNLLEQSVNWKDCNGKSPIDLLMENDGLSPGWITSCYDLCPSAFWDVDGSDNGDDTTLLHRMFKYRPGKIQVMTVPLVVEALKAIPVELLRRETIEEKQTPVHYLIDDENLFGQLTHDDYRSYVDLYPLFVVASRFKKLEPVIERYKDRNERDLFCEPEVDEAPADHFKPSLHARDIVALLTGYPAGHKLWTFAFEYILQPQLLIIRDEDDPNLAWPVEGNTFPTGSCEVRGEARVVEKDARGGKTLDVTPNRLLEWDYAMRQMCKCTHPTLCGDSGILASEEIEVALPGVVDADAGRKLLSYLAMGGGKTLDAFSSPAIKYACEFRWRAIGMWYYYGRLSVWLLFILFHAFAANAKSGTPLQQSCAIVTIGFTLFFLILESFQLLTFVKLHAGRNPLSSEANMLRYRRAFCGLNVHRRRNTICDFVKLAVSSLARAVALYLADVFNLFDLTSSILSITAMWVSIAQLEGSGYSADLVQSLMSLSTAMVGVRTFDELRGESHLGFYTFLLEEIVGDLIAFAAIVIFSLLLFTVAMMPLTASHFEDEGHSEEAEHPFSWIVSGFGRAALMAMGDWDMQEFAAMKGWSINDWRSSGGEHFGIGSSSKSEENVPALAHAILIVFVFAVPLVMMNLIIALLSETFDRVMEQRVRVLVRQRMQITMHAETLADIFCCGCCRCCQSPEQVVERKLTDGFKQCCLSMSETFYPDTLLVLRPEGTDDSEDAEAGAIRMQKLSHLVEARTDRLAQQVRDLVEIMQTELPKTVAMAVAARRNEEGVAGSSTELSIADSAATPLASSLTTSSAPEDASGVLTLKEMLRMAEAAAAGKEAAADAAARIEDSSLIDAVTVFFEGTDGIHATGEEAFANIEGIFVRNSNLTCMLGEFSVFTKLEKGKSGDGSGDGYSENVHLYRATNGMWYINSVTANMAAGISTGLVYGFATNSGHFSIRSSATPLDLVWKYHNGFAWEAAPLLRVESISQAELMYELPQNLVDKLDQERCHATIAVSISGTQGANLGGVYAKAGAGRKSIGWETETTGNDIVIDQDDARVTRTNSSSWGTQVTEAFTTDVTVSVSVDNGSSNYLAIGVLDAVAEWTGTTAMSSLSKSRYYYADGTLKSESEGKKDVPALKGEGLELTMAIDMTAHTITFSRDGTEIGVLQDVPTNARVFATFGGSNQFVTISGGSSSSGDGGPEKFGAPYFTLVGREDTHLYRGSNGAWNIGTTRAMDEGEPGWVESARDRPSFAPLNLEWYDPSNRRPARVAPRLPGSQAARGHHEMMRSRSASERTASKELGDVIDLVVVATDMDAVEYAVKCAQEAEEREKEMVQSIPGVALIGSSAFQTIGCMGVFRKSQVLNYGDIVSGAGPLDVAKNGPIFTSIIDTGSFGELHLYRTSTGYWVVNDTAGVRAGTDDGWVRSAAPSLSPLLGQGAWLHLRSEDSKDGGVTITEEDYIRAGDDDYEHIACSAKTRDQLDRANAAKNAGTYTQKTEAAKLSGVVINWTQPQGGSVPSTLAPLMGLYSRIDPEEDTASGVEPDSEAAYLNDAPAFTLNDAFFLFRLSDGKWIVGGGHNYSAARKIADARPERVEEAAADILHILNGEGPGAQRVRIMTEGANFSPVDATIQYEFIDTMEDFSHPLDSSGHTSEMSWNENDDSYLSVSAATAEDAAAMAAAIAAEECEAQATKALIVVGATLDSVSAQLPRSLEGVWVQVTDVNESSLLVKAKAKLSQKTASGAVPAYALVGAVDAFIYHGEKSLWYFGDDSGTVWANATSASCSPVRKALPWFVAGEAAPGVFGLSAASDAEFEAARTAMDSMVRERAEVDGTPAVRVSNCENAACVGMYAQGSSLAWRTETLGNDIAIDQDATRITRTNSSSWGNHVTEATTSSSSITLKITNDSQYFHLGVCNHDAGWSGAKSSSDLAGSCYLKADKAMYGSGIAKGTATGGEIKGTDFMMTMEADTSTNTVTFLRDGSSIGSISGIPEHYRFFVCFGGAGQFVTMQSGGGGSQNLAPIFTHLENEDMKLYRMTSGKWGVGRTKHLTAGREACMYASTDTSFSPLSLGWDAAGPPKIVAATQDELSAEISAAKGRKDAEDTRCKAEAAALRGVTMSSNIDGAVHETTWLATSGATMNGAPVFAMVGTKGKHLYLGETKQWVVGTTESDASTRKSWLRSVNKSHSPLNLGWSTLRAPLCEGGPHTMIMPGRLWEKAFRARQIMAIQTIGHPGGEVDVVAASEAEIAAAKTRQVSDAAEIARVQKLGAVVVAGIVSDTPVKGKIGQMPVPFFLRGVEHRHLNGVYAREGPPKDVLKWTNETSTLGNDIAFDGDAGVKITRTSSSNWGVQCTAAYSGKAQMTLCITNDSGYFHIGVCAADATWSGAAASSSLKQGCYLKADKALYCGSSSVGTASCSSELKGTDFKITMVADSSTKTITFIRDGAIIGSVRGVPSSYRFFVCFGGSGQWVSAIGTPAELAAMTGGGTPTCFTLVTTPHDAGAGGAAEVRCLYRSAEDDLWRISSENFMKGCSGSGQWYSETMGQDISIDEDGARITRTSSSSWGSQATDSFTTSASLKVKITNDSGYFHLGVCEHDAAWTGSGVSSSLAGSCYMKCDRGLYKKDAQAGTATGAELKGSDFELEMKADMTTNTITFFRDGSAIGSVSDIPANCRFFVCFGGSGQYVTIVGAGGALSSEDAEVEVAIVGTTTSFCPLDLAWRPLLGQQRASVRSAWSESAVSVTAASAAQVAEIFTPEQIASFGSS